MADEPHDYDEDDDDGVELDPEVAARRDEALRAIVKIGEPVLRTVARPVDTFDEELRAEIEWMSGLMHDALGVGLAAPQVGISHRAFVYRVEQDGPVIALINPVIEAESKETEVEFEGCLSIPGVQVEVQRPAQVRVRAQDVTGAEIEIDADGLEARVIQHELDHLDGVLILDRTTKDQRKAAIRALREAEPAA